MACFFLDTFKNADAFEESDPFNSAFSKSNVRIFIGSYLETISNNF
jgi:hypothetical protein